MTKPLATTNGIANKGFSGLRSSVVYSKFCSGGQEHSPQSMLSYCLDDQFFSKKFPINF